jgi:replicative DNA helicase
MVESQIINKLLTNKQSLIIASQFESGIFLDHKNRELFKIMCSLLNDGLNVDYSVVMSYLKKVNRFDQFGEDYFLDLMSQQPIYNLNTSLNNMNEKLTRDRIKENSKDLFNSIKNGELDYTQFIDRIIELQNNLNKNNDNCICIKEFPDSLDEVFSKHSYLPFNIKILDEKLKGLFSGNIITLAGQPGSGKTTLALQIAFNYDSLFVSLEMTAAELYSKILSRLCEIPAIKIETNSLENYEIDKINKCHFELKDNKNFHILTAPNNFNKLCSMIKFKVQTYNLKMVVIDYLQLCQIPGTDTNTKLEYMTQTLKAIAKELNVPIVLLSQLTKDSYKNNSIPSLADLRGSGSIAQDSDVVFFLYYDDDKRLKFTVAKGRKYKIGVIENLYFNGMFSRFEEKFI